MALRWWVDIETRPRPCGKCGQPDLMRPQLCTPLSCVSVRLLLDRLCQACSSSNTHAGALECSRSWWRSIWLYVFHISSVNATEKLSHCMKSINVLLKWYLHHIACKYLVSAIPYHIGTQGSKGPTSIKLTFASHITTAQLRSFWQHTSYILQHECIHITFSAAVYWPADSWLS